MRIAPTLCELDYPPYTYRERERVLTQGIGPPIIPLVKPDMPRFAGGGFNLKQTQKTSA